MGRSGAPAIGYRVDRSALLDLEAVFGEENLVGVAITKHHCWIIHANDDMFLPHSLAGYAPEGWVELEKVEIWSDALVSLGALLDEFIEEVPIDELSSPSPTVIIAYNEPTDKALADGLRTTLDVVYRTVDGVRSAQELKDSSGTLIFRIEDEVWDTFADALNRLSAIFFYAD